MLSWDLGLEVRGDNLKTPDLLDDQVGLGHLELDQTETLQVFGLSQEVGHLPQVGVVGDGQLD